MVGSAVCARMCWSACARLFQPSLLADVCYRTEGPKQGVWKNQHTLELETQAKAMAHVQLPSCRAGTLWFENNGSNNVRP